MPPQLEKNHVVLPSSQDEAQAKKLEHRNLAIAGSRDLNPSHWTLRPSPVTPLGKVRQCHAPLWGRSLVRIIRGRDMGLLRRNKAIVK